MNPFLNKYRLPLVLLIFSVTGLAIYSNSFNVPYQFDDMTNILDSSAIQVQNPGLLEIINAGKHGFLKNRPIANISLALNYYFSGNALPGYHLVNILIHILAATFLFQFLHLTLNLQYKNSADFRISAIAFLAALIWLVHPVHTQSVTYIVQRMNSMASMFFILAMLSYVNFRSIADKGMKIFWLCLCLLSALFALGTKEIAITLPVFLFVYEWYFFQDLDAKWLKKKSLPICTIIILLIAISFIYMGADPFRALLDGYKVRDFTLVERVLTQPRVIIFYISQLLLPHPSRLNLDHHFIFSQGWLNPSATLYAFAGILGMIILAIHAARKDRFLSFGIFWFLGNLVIESSIIPLEIIYEHRSYLPSMMLIPVAVIIVYRATGWDLKKILVSGLFAAVMFSLWTYQRNITWQTPLALWSDCAQKSPLKARSHNNLGKTLADKGEHLKALEHFSTAIKQSAKPESQQFYNKAVSLEFLGRIDESIDYYNKALTLAPNYLAAHNNLGIAYARLNNLELAAYHFKEALRINPNDSPARQNLARCNLIIHQQQLKK